MFCALLIRMHNTIYNLMLIYSLITDRISFIVKRLRFVFLGVRPMNVRMNNINKRHNEDAYV